jgi:hypothetical protein
LNTFADKVAAFNRALRFEGDLPSEVEIMNPFKNSADALSISDKFYYKFFNDLDPRSIILGINPGRFGAGVTGIPFTDTQRLNENCGIPLHGFKSYEPSSSFVYEMINAVGGAAAFYKQFFISAICPLGFTIRNLKGKMVNYNYYDSRQLTNAVYPFIIDTLKQQLDFGISRKVCFCLGTGKNEAFLRKINNEYRFFESIIALEHPRYIMQYKSKSKDGYINKYLEAFRSK